MVPGARPNQAGQQLTEMRRVIGAMVGVALLGCGLYALLASRRSLGGAAVGVAAPNASAPMGGPAHTQARLPAHPVDHAAPGSPSSPAAAASLPDARTRSEAPAHDRASALATRAWTALEAGKLDAARLEARGCLELDHTRSECRSALVASFTRVGDWEHAYTPLVDCLDQNPANASCLAAMTRYQLRHGKLDEAKRRVDALVALGDSSADAAFAIGEYAATTKDLPRACTSFQSACKQALPDSCKRAREVCPSADLRIQPAQ
jgi:hypothetical protein